MMREIERAVCSCGGVVEEQEQTAATAAAAAAVHSYSPRWMAQAAASLPGSPRRGAADGGGSGGGGGGGSGGRGDAELRAGIARLTEKFASTLDILQRYAEAYGPLPGPHPARQ